MGTKLRAMLKSVFGERVDQMMELSGLATSPAKQGRGYATALVRTLNDMVKSAAYLTFDMNASCAHARVLLHVRQADSRGCAVWVFTDDESGSMRSSATYSSQKNGRVSTIRSGRVIPSLFVS